jgi:hypothetical protein
VGFAELPDTIPEWMQAEAPLPEPPSCDCGCGPPEPPAAEEPVAWTVPGVTGFAPFGEPDRLAGLPPPSPGVRQLQDLVRGLATGGPVELPAAQALADGQALLAVEQGLRVLNLRRVGDVAARGLHELLGHRSAKAWLRTHRPDGDADDARLAAQLRHHPVLQTAVEQRLVPLASARKVTRALAKVGPHLDRPDGRIDGQPGEEVLPAVVQHVFTIVCRYLAGLADADPRLPALVDRATTILALPGQLQVVEAACSWLAEQLPARQLTGPLDEIVTALLPSELDQRADQGHARRGLSLTPLPDGTGWHLCGDLTLEAGERLWTALRAEAARDPANPTDTTAWEQARNDGSAGVGPPRGRRQRLHDALNRLLGRYLEHGLGGTHAKRPVQISVTVHEQTLTSRPGAPPPVTDSGRLLPRALLRRWWCDATVTSYVLSLGGTALRAVHSQRMPTGTEQRALQIETGGRCIGDGCCPADPDPLVPLRPHHVLGYAENQATSLDEIVPVCDTLHHDIHDGHRTIRLRNGRYHNEHGYLDHPSIEDHPPF